MRSAAQAACCPCNLRGPSPYQPISHKRQHWQPPQAVSTLPCRPGFLRQVSSIIEWIHRLTGWPFDGTHWLIGPPSARQVAGQAGWRRGGPGTRMLQVNLSSVLVWGIWMRTRLLSHSSTLPSLSLGNTYVTFLVGGVSTGWVHLSRLYWDWLWFYYLFCTWQVSCSAGWINALKCPFRVDMKATCCFFHGVTKVKMKCTLSKEVCRGVRWGRAPLESEVWEKSTSKWSEIKCGGPKNRHWCIPDISAFIRAMLVDSLSFPFKSALICGEV